MSQLKERDDLRELQPEARTQPRVHYRNLHRYTHEFVGGTVVATINGVTDCVAGASVRLTASGTSVGEAVTDAFGEFKIDHLEPGSGEYELTIEIGGQPVKALRLEVTDSVYLGRIELSD